jgi:signal recognition particle subunit SRP54
MTPDDRRSPQIIDGSRLKRIEAGSGTIVHEVNPLIGRFQEMRKMMKRFSKMAGKFDFQLPAE